MKEHLRLENKGARVSVGPWNSFAQMTVALREAFDKITPDEYKNNCRIELEGYDGDVSLVVSYKRPETLQEAQDRPNQQAKYQEVERQQYLLLKKKFESDETA